MTNSFLSILKQQFHKAPSWDLCYFYYIQKISHVQLVPHSRSTQMTAVLASSWQLKNLITKLQIQLDLLVTYWKLTNNSSKTNAVLFTRKRSVGSSQSLPLLKILNSNIVWNDSVKYLSLVLNRKLTWSLAVEDRRIKAFRVLQASKVLIGHKSKLPLGLKILIYTTCIRSVMLYGAQIWSAAARSHLLSLQQFQNFALKIILNIPRDRSTTDLHNRTTVNRLNVLINRTVSGYKVDDHPNKLVRDTSTI